MSTPERQGRRNRKSIHLLMSAAASTQAGW